VNDLLYFLLTAFDNVINSNAATIWNRNKTNNNPRQKPDADEAALVADN
jgi:hypothetical protein